MLRLHYTPGSFFSRKVRIALAEKGLPYEPHVEGSSRNRSADIAITRAKGQHAACMRARSPHDHRDGPGARKEQD